MKVLILTSAFPPEAEGAATHLPEMAVALQKLGHRVRVLAVVNRHEVRDTYSFRVQRISRSQVFFVRNIRLLFALIRESRRFDVFYVYGVWWQATLVALITGIPLITKFTGDKIWEETIEKNKSQLDVEDFQKNLKGLWQPIRHTLYRLWARLSRKLVVSCDTLCRVLMSWGIPREQIEIIPNALPENPRDQEQATYLAQWGNKDGLRLICCGHIIKAKQLDEVLEVLAKFDNMLLVVAGDGPDLERIKNLTPQMNLTDRVLFTGKISRQDLAGYISECDVLVLNSRIGRFNYAILEALSQQKPVVATRRGLHADFIEHGVNGWLYPSGNTQEFYELLSDIQTHRRRLNVSDADTLPTWDEQVDLIQDLLESQT